MIPLNRISIAVRAHDNRNNIAQVSNIARFSPSSDVHLIGSRAPKGLTCGNDSSMYSSFEKSSLMKRPRDM